MTPKLNILVAYPYMTDRMVSVLKANSDIIRFVLDSGAFTAWNSGKTIILKDYCRFLETLPFKPWRYFTLDVIGNPVETWDNYQQMLKRGFEPVPILTKGENKTQLDSYYETSDLVAIGGINSVTNKRMFVKRAMKMVGNRRTHLLGFTDFDYIKFYKPYMCDSSGYDQSRFGQIRLYIGKGKMTYVKKNKAHKATKEQMQAVARYGVKPSELMQPSAWQGTRNTAMFLNCASMIKMSAELESAIGTKQFLAESSPDKVQWLATIHRKLYPTTTAPV